MDADALCRPDDDWLKVNGGAESGGEPFQESLFEVFTIQEGRQPINRPTRRAILKDVT
jgi:hypothetical protein